MKIRGEEKNNTIIEMTEKMEPIKNSSPELGVMLDCSRGAVTSIPALKQFIQLCAKMGYTFVGLYAEDTIEVEDEPYFGYQRGRYTKEEIREADAYAHSLGVELRPYIQTLAHLNQITDYADYASCIDTDDILLAGEKRTYQLLDRLLHSVSEAFQSRKIKIGMDEAHMVGLGKYLDQHGYVDRIDILRKHLEKVLLLCRKYNLHAEMWSDMFFRLLTHGEYYLEGDLPLAEKVDIPENVSLCYWDYYSLDPDHYRNMIKLHRRLTNQITFAGGAWRWIGFAPCNRYSIAATNAALEACCENDVSSIVLTLWGDDGGECSIFSLLPTLYLAAERVKELWKEKSREMQDEDPQEKCKRMQDEDSQEKSKEIQSAGSLDDFRENLTGYSIDAFLLLDEANPAGGDPTAKNNLCKILFYNDPLLGIFDCLTDEDGMKKLVREYSDACRRIREARQESQKYKASAEMEIMSSAGEKTRLSMAEKIKPSAHEEYKPSAAVEHPDFSYLFETQEALCDFLAEKADFGVRLRTAYLKKDCKTLAWIAEKEIESLIQKLDRFYTCLRQQWMKENKPFGFEVHTIRIGGMKQRFADIRTLLRNYLDGELPVIEELEEKRLPPGYVFDSLDPYNLVWERYEKIATTSRLTW